ncbi:unnamed protein product [Phyllotreta striolata]|uniref:Uncharacterized protein n=1 Tax=Phyllotreta striolata TaxID=444603 RepID=A0A9N9XSV1_PHYSR|nr:unnamed protein product [Phyllotreta striolata]
MDFYVHFKKYEYILNGKSQLLSDKVIILIKLWTELSEYDFSNTELKSLIDLIDWAIIHTMNITLTAEWQVYADLFKNELLLKIELSSKNFLARNLGFRNRFDKLNYVIAVTWANPTLEKLINIPNCEITNEEMEFFRQEQAHLVSIRLMMLCKSNCEDLALNLVTAFLKYLKSEHFKDDCCVSAEQKWFIFDMKLVLLYKFKDVDELESMIKLLSYEDGLYLINRFMKKNPKLMKIWKYSPNIVTIALPIYLQEILKENNSNNHEIFNQLIELFLSKNSIEDFKNLFLQSDLLTLLNRIKTNKNPLLKSYILELFVKNLTTFINQIEALKDTENATKTESATAQLAEIYSDLAEFMADKVKVARECVLTAFSLKPTQERLTNLEKLAQKSGLQIDSDRSNWVCKLHPPIDEDDARIYKCPECNKLISVPQVDNPLKVNLALNDAINTLDLPPELCEDLINCISNPRYKVLSWYIPWIDLYRICLLYLSNERGIRNFITELKFLDIDYSMFDDAGHHPLQEYGGIEKGYEKYLDSSFNPNEDEEEPETRSENCAIEGEDYDPNSIESLKKILSIQNSQEHDSKNNDVTHCSKNILTQSNSQHKDKRSKFKSNNFKRKLRSFTKDKSRKKRKHFKRAE